MSWNRCAGWGLRSYPHTDSTHNPQRDDLLSEAFVIDEGASFLPQGSPF